MIHFMLITIIKQEQAALIREDSSSKTFRTVAGILNDNYVLNARLNTGSEYSFTPVATHHSFSIVSEYIKQLGRVRNNT